MLAPSFSLHNILGKIQLPCITCLSLLLESTVSTQRANTQLSSSLACSQDVTQWQMFQVFGWLGGPCSKRRSSQWVPGQDSIIYPLSTHSFVMFLWPASRICQHWTLSKQGKDPEPVLSILECMRQGLKMKNITPLLFKKKNSEMRSDCLRNLGKGHLGSSVG